MHILPDLRRLEEKYRDELVVIGVHSAKFTNERKSENIRRILVRYDIDHPVVNDADFAIWKAYGARAWPTQVLIDPEGYVVATASRRRQGRRVRPGDRGRHSGVRRAGEDQSRPDSRVARAGTAPNVGAGVSGEGARRRTGVAGCSSPTRIITACSLPDLDGHVTSVIGGGAGGRGRDGSFDDARFYRPQGLALDGDTLYVADTENHAIRAVDLTRRQVTTVAGIGRQAAWGEQRRRGARDAAQLAVGPRAVAVRLLFVAMAGSHQIWMLDLVRSLAIPYAGSGREARVDGSIDDAAFAQPSGLAIGGATLYRRRQRANIIRAVRLPPTNDVRTIAGGDLFEFGDRDGSR